MEKTEEQELDIYSVRELNETVRDILEDNFENIWVEGEISNFIVPNSGHWYFSLKDPDAQVRCAMFRGNQRKLGFKPKDGMHVLVKAKVSLYPNRGDYQLIVDFMEERGEGKLRRAYEQLKQKLEKKGLFDESHKQELPLYPDKIGIITSQTGAAVRDILNVLKRRYPSAPVIIYPTLVQGTTAAPTIVNAIETANKRNECDLIILARGGGSLEDLWPFNEEMVANAIYKSKLPIVTGIGHEVDFTIADFVADLRAPTPSAAAELATPDKEEILYQLAYQARQLNRSIKRMLDTIRNQLKWTMQHLQQQHPKRKLKEKQQQLHLHVLSLINTIRQQLSKQHAELSKHSNSLTSHSPLTKIKASQAHIALMGNNLMHLIKSQIKQKENALANQAASLDALSPLATLKRGYSIATHQEKVLRDVSKLKAGDELSIKLYNGDVDCRVEKITKPH